MSYRSSLMFFCLLFSVLAPESILRYLTVSRSLALADCFFSPFPNRDQAMAKLNKLQLPRFSPSLLIVITYKLEILGRHGPSTF